MNTNSDNTVEGEEVIPEMPVTKLAWFAVPIDPKKIASSLPDECSITVEHALVHLNGAMRHPTNKEALLHDVDMAARILMCLTHSLVTGEILYQGDTTADEPFVEEDQDSNAA